MSEARELRLTALLGCEVRDTAGQTLGHIHEVVAGDDGGELAVRAYVTGAMGEAARLNAASVARHILAFFGLRLAHEGYIVRWDQMDLSDPTRLRTTCSRELLDRPGRDGSI